VILTARVVGGLPMLDHGEADDKIIAVLLNDLQWGEVRELDELPPALVDRLRHYFATYKTLAGQAATTVTGEPYDRKHAETVIRAAIADYEEFYGAASREAGAAAWTGAPPAPD
jgi:inorganic pyrophosphatase